MIELTSEQKRRYDRHIILDGFGKNGQIKLLQSRVLVVGAGGLGSAVLMYLAAAGVGTLGIVDGDTVSITNLQRQIIHGTSGIGRPKVDTAAERIMDINPDIKIEKHDYFLDEDNALNLISQYDYVVEGSDNFATKYLVNDACIMLDKPFCIAGITRYSGQVMAHVPGSACYRCLFPEPPENKDVETCSMVGVLGSIAGIIGTIQATEAIKHLAGVGKPLINTLLNFDAITMFSSKLYFNKSDKCAVCGSNPTIKELKEYAFQPCSKK